MHRCPTCDVPVVQSGKGRRRIYCSRQCQERRPTPKAAPPEPRPCESCGERFTPLPHLAGKQRRCSAVCGKPGPKPCPYCGNLMTNPRRVQCGNAECKRLWINERNLAFQRKHKAESGQYYSRRYAYEKVCEVCGNTWQATSTKARYCSTACTNTIRTYERTCEECDTTWVSVQSTARWCSTKCSNAAKHGWPTCRIPVDHPVRAVPSTKLYRVYFPDCRWCGTTFTTQQPAHKLCSKQCARREARARRKARERGAAGTYTWAEVIGLFLAFDRCCAYCRQPVDGQLEPDHVVPLSRGGSNSITNILPSCRSCNGDKRDLLLDEWAVDRTRRGLPPRYTRWTRGDPLYRHLTIIQSHEQAA